MAVNTTTLPVPIDRAFSLFEDSRSLSYVVVGTRTIRSFHPRWPELGTEIHHSIGIGPLVLRDSTEVVEVDPPKLLVLEARIRPFGELRAELRFSPHAGETSLSVVEYPLHGAIALPGVGRLVDGLIVVRNKEMLRRVSRLIESREQQRHTTWAVS